MMVASAVPLCFVRERDRDLQPKVLCLLYVCISRLVKKIPFLCEECNVLRQRLHLNLLLAESCCLWMISLKLPLGESMPEHQTLK